MTVYTGPVFEMSRRQLDVIADHRTAAMSIGVEKVRSGKRLRGLFP